MKIRWLHLLIPIAGAASAATLTTVVFWDAAKPFLLTALSVIAAGVLVRLARGLPFTSSEQFELDEIRQVTAALKQSVRALRALITVVFLGMGSLILAQPLTNRLAAITTDSPEVLSYADTAITAVVGFLITYIFVRLFAVVSGDVGLVDLQAKFIEQSVQRKQAERFNEVLAEDDTPKMRNPKGYGKVIQ
ncbi:MAG: hypothetical protein ACE360_00605 [Hyphomicrobiales bacterium]